MSADSLVSGLNPVKTYIVSNIDSEQEILSTPTKIQFYDVYQSFFSVTRKRQLAAIAIHLNTR